MPKKHHLDRRAGAIAAAGPGPEDDLLSTQQVADWFGVSIQWLEIGRCKGNGPPFERLGPGLIKYRRGKLLKWLDEREYTHTKQYRKAPAARRAKA